ncbi:MAG: hypothetical protein VX007_02585, partial [Pseudomonadota bacterium]|nr:hypothetical protein [Pseudomonadota bacterium]
LLKGGFSRENNQIRCAAPHVLGRSHRGFRAYFGSGVLWFNAPLPALNGLYRAYTFEIYTNVWDRGQFRPPDNPY